MSLLARLLGREPVPDGFGGALQHGERVLAAAGTTSGGHLVATTLGLWVPDGDGNRRIGWQWISKATWDRSTLVIIEATETGAAGAAVLLGDRPPRRYPLAESRKVPQVVRERVTVSIRTSQHRELAGGGAWFVQRKLPDGGVVLQVRPEPGTDEATVRQVAADVADRMSELRTRE